LLAIFDSLFGNYDSILVIFIIYKRIIGINFVTFEKEKKEVTKAIIKDLNTKYLNPLLTFFLLRKPQLINIIENAILIKTIILTKIDTGSNKININVPTDNPKIIPAIMESLARLSE